MLLQHYEATIYYLKMISNKDIRVCKHCFLAFYMTYEQITNIVKYTRILLCIFLSLCVIQSVSTSIIYKKQSTLNSTIYDNVLVTLQFFFSQ